MACTTFPSLVDSRGPHLQRCCFTDQVGGGDGYSRMQASLRGPFQGAGQLRHSPCESVYAHAPADDSRGHEQHLHPQLPSDEMPKQMQCYDLECLRSDAGKAAGACFGCRVLLMGGDCSDP